MHAPHYVFGEKAQQHSLDDEHGARLEIIGLVLSYCQHEENWKPGQHCHYKRASSRAGIIRMEAADITVS
jgi:hypothetical protein